MSRPKRTLEQDLACLDKVRSDLAYYRRMVARCVKAKKGPARDAMLWTLRKNVGRLTQRLYKLKCKVKAPIQTRTGAF